MRQLKRGWINEYLQWIEQTSESPKAYHYWSAATVVAGACKRNVWVNRGDFNLFPNLYTVLVGHTGLGKGRGINPAVSILRDSGVANIMSDKLTIQYILEKISDRGHVAANMTLAPAAGGQISFSLDSSCFISAPELEDLLTTSDAMPPLKELWESKDGTFEYGTRGKGLVKISKPCPTLLGGCTPSQISFLFPTKSVGGGFVRRCNFVYEAERDKLIPWPMERNVNDPIRASLVNDLRHIAQLKGIFSFDPHARKIFEEYYNNTHGDEFADEATASYETSRPYHALKLAMALTVSRFDTMIINFLDMSHAIQMVNKCTEDLKRVFRSVGDSDLAVVMDKVIRYIEIKGKLMYVTRQDLMGALWKDVGSSNNLDIILATLEAGKVVKVEQRSGITTYRVTKSQPLNGNGSGSQTIQ